MSDRDPDSGAKASGVVKASELNAALETLDHIIEEQQDIEDEPEIDPEELPETPQGVPILADVVVPGDLSLIEDEEPIPIIRLPRLEDVRRSAGDAATAGQEVPRAELCRKLIDELESIIDNGLKRATEEARASILREVRSQVEAALQGHGAPSAPAVPQFATRSAGVPADEGFRLHLLPEGTVHVDSATPDSDRADELAREVREALNSMRGASAGAMDPVPVAPASTQSVSEIQEPQTSMSEPTPATRGAEGTTPAAEALSKTYEPHAIEQRWYETWEQQGYFQPAGQGRPYCIMLPPPNVTGTLHMGHAFQDTLMDALIRYHRMQGQSTLWQGGTDHAGIATQMVVERQLLEQGTRRTDLGREAFVEAVWKWTSVSGGAITRQLRRIGTSIDWSRQRFTLDEGLSRAVTEVFVRLYHDGLIYRGKRLVNWDPVLHTAISDLEVVSQEEQGHIWHIRYPLADGPGHVVVATTRPETLLGDTAVAVHPDDERYRHLVGQQVMLPLAGRAIPIVADAHVDPTFGSGCLKITPAHDFNDYAVAQRHNLPLVNIFTPDASIGPEAPAPYVGLDRMTARKRVVADLEAQGLLEKVENRTIMVPRGDRSHAIIEPYLTDQWFVRAAPLAAPAIQAVEQGQIRFVPENWSRTYFEWMRNIQDWCISRQLWWGHRIPAWYDQHQRVFVGRSETEVRAREGLGPDVDLRQDTDVLDTWFSSALWPFSTLGWPETTPVLKTFYPTSVLVTGFDIIFFWVARMIMMGLRFTGQVPFREVYIHGLVRDQDGQKMSKSKGNILDPIDLIDGIDLETLVGKRTTGLMRPQDAPKIEAATRKQFPDGIAGYGADALRVTFAALASPGRDINFDLGRIEGYRNFCNKLWNAARYVLMTCTANGSLIEGSAVQLGLAERWILSRLQQAVGEVTESYAEYRFDLATKAIYSFVWDEYCDWYVELSKTVLNDPQAPAAAKRGTRQVLVGVLETLLRLAHPIMPFITEEIWQRVAPLAGAAGETIMLQPFPQRDAALADDTASREIEWVKSFVLGVRRVRAEMNISPGKPLAVLVRGGTAAERTWLANYGRYLLGLTRATSIRELQGETAPDAATALAGNMTLLIPLADLIDPAAEFQRLSKEVERIRADRQRLEAKLQNQNFVERAPAEVVAKERARYVDLGTALARLEEQLGRIAALRSS